MESRLGNSGVQAFGRSAVRASGVLGAAAAVLAACSAASAQTIAIRAGTLMPVSGPPVKNAVVVVRDGKIVAAGRGVSIPRGARVIRASVVMPGLVDPHTYLGCATDIDEPVDAVTPDLRACDAFDPTAREVRLAIEAGITSVGIAPGNGNVVGGQIAAVRLANTPEILSGYAAQKLSISLDAASPQRNPTSRAGVVAMARNALSGARLGATATSSRQASLLIGEFPTSLSERSRALGPVLTGKKPVFVHAPTASDVEMGLAITKEYRLRPVFLHSTDAWRIDGVQGHVILGPLKLGDADRVLESPARLARRGAKVAFCTDGPNSDPASLRQTAHLAVKYGMNPAEAIRAITLAGAEALGVDGRTGSIQVGKDADLLLLSGDPLNLTSRIEAVISGGKVIHEAK